MKEVRLKRKPEKENEELAGEDRTEGTKRLGKSAGAGLWRGGRSRS